MPGAVTHVERLRRRSGSLISTSPRTPPAATLTWNLTPRDGIKLGRLRWPLPQWVKVTRHAGAVREGDVLRATGNTGEIEVSWTRLPDQGPTYAGTLAALQGGYLSRGLTPPG